jgi:hypothetical protein
MPLKLDQERAKLMIYSVGVIPVMQILSKMAIPMQINNHSLVKKNVFNYLKLKKMKLSKFEVEKLTIDEMNAIKAGSGTCKTGEHIQCSSATMDADDFVNGDSDGD